jgi:hypothetical protein
MQTEKISGCFDGGMGRGGGTQGIWRAGDQLHRTPHARDWNRTPPPPACTSPLLERCSLHRLSVSMSAVVRDVEAHGVILYGGQENMNQRGNDGGA